MYKSLRLLFCISMLALGVAPLAEAQNARSSSFTIIREGRPDYRGRSYYYRQPTYRDSHYYRRNDPRYDRDLIIRIGTDDCYDDRSRYGYPARYYRGRGETYYRDAVPSSYQDR